MNNLKEVILESLINCGKKNKRLKAPVMILITLFLILFHGIRNFFMQFKLHPFRRRVLAGALCVCLIVSSVLAVVCAFPALAAENSEDVQENVQEEIQENTYGGIREIVSFTELPDEVKEQTVAVGTSLESLTLPDTLTVVCRMGNEKHPEDNADSDNEQDSEEEDKQTDEGSEEESGDFDNEEEGNEDESGDSDNEEEGNEDESGDSDNEGEETGDESEDSDNEGEGTGDESEDSDNEGEGNEEESGDFGSEGEENEEAVEKQETFTVTLPEYYAMPDELPEIKELFYEETVAIDGITWESQPEYDSEMEGVYLFTPVISDGAYTLAEDVRLPEITVTVAEAEIMLAEEEGSMTPMCGVISSDTTWGAGELSDGTLTVKEGVTLTITGVMTVSDNVTINGGGTIKRGDADACFNISSGSNVIMSRIVIDGDSLEATENSMIDVSRGAALTLDDGCVIERCARVKGDGGAISNSGTVIMNGSTISNCYTNSHGGAISNNGMGTVIMNGSTISNCYTKFDGGAIRNIGMGTVTMKDSTIRNCHAGQGGGAIYTVGGSINIKSATIEKCYATEYGGAIASTSPRANIIIEDGMFNNNRAIGSGPLASWGGGCICNGQGELHIYGGNFIENESGFAGGCISHLTFPGAITEITGGNFEGNGKDAIYVESGISSPSHENKFILSGNVHFGNGENGGADIDGVEVQFEKYVYENGNVQEGKIWINGTIIDTIPVYLPENIPASEGLVIAEGKDGYKLSKSDAEKISVTNTSAPEEIWYAVLDEERNVIYLSQAEPMYGYSVTYYSNGAEGTVTDEKEYTDSDNIVTVKDAATLSYDGYVFDGWNTKADGTGTSYKSGDTFTITSNIDLYAQWKIDGVVYTVEHYLQDVSGDGYTRAEADTEILGGYVGEEVIAKPIAYRGFTENTTHASRQESGVVASDGSLVLRLYYDRDVYHISFDLNGGTGTTPETQEVRYGALLREVSKPEKAGFTFQGWYMGGSRRLGKAWDFSKTVEENTENKSEILYAGWLEASIAEGNKAPVDNNNSPTHNSSSSVSEQVIALIDESQPLKTVDSVRTDEVQPLKTTDPARDNEPRTGDTTQVKVYATIAMVSGLLYLLLYFTTDRNGMTQEEKEQFLSCLVSWAQRGGKPRRLLATAVIFLFLVYYHSIGRCAAYDEKEIVV